VNSLAKYKHIMIGFRSLYAKVFGHRGLK